MAKRRRARSRKTVKIEKPAGTRADKLGTTRIVKPEETLARRRIVARLRFADRLSLPDIKRALDKQGFQAALSTIATDVEWCAKGIKADFSDTFDATTEVAKIIQTFDMIEERAVHQALRGTPGAKLHALRVAGFAAQAKFDVMRETRLIPDELTLGDRDKRPDERLPNAKEIRTWLDQARVLDAQLVPTAESEGDYGSEVEEPTKDAAQQRRLPAAPSTPNVGAAQATGTEDLRPGDPDAGLPAHTPVRRIRAVSSGS